MAMYDDFLIHLESLKSGEHSFKFALNKTFFESLEYSIIDDGEVEVQLTLLKKERLTELFTEFSGKLKLDCDRCGEQFYFPIESENETVLKYGNESFIDEGIWMIEQNQKDINIKHFLYETICLSIPSKVTHEDSLDEECSQELLDKLASYSSDKDNKNTDPRWDALNKLK